VTCEPCPCLSRFPRQPRSSRLSQASTIAAEALMHNAGEASKADTSISPRATQLEDHAGKAHKSCLA
jgi:hypothetical protein